MKTTIHKANTRGHADHGWLNAHHTFSFASYNDPSRVHFGLLRVLNDDIVAPGMGFGQHPHDNMEIVTIPIKGELEHKDTMGTSSVIRPGEVQIMSAGSGLQHSEFNHSKTEPINLLQTWIFPKERNIQPRYDQRAFTEEDKLNRFKIVVSPDKTDDAMWINQDAYYALGKIEAGKTIDYVLKNKAHGVYIFIIDGKVTVDGTTLDKRDGMGVWETDKFSVQALEASEVLLMEVPMN